MITEASPLRHPVRQNQQNIQRTQVPVPTSYDVPGPDMMVLAATINHQVAYRNVMLPLLAENLRKAGAETNLHDIFLSTSECIKSEKPSQSPEFRSTMRYKICLKKTFNPDYRYYSKPKHDDGCVLA